MYSKEFCDIYNEYGWAYFSITMGQAILDYFKSNNIEIKRHLDLGCGVGTLCDFYYKQGINTTGVDINEYMIQKCKEKNSNINFVVNNIEKFISSEKYDLITMTCDVVNHILDEDSLKKIFYNIYNMLNDDGYLIFDIINSNKLILNKQIVSNRDNNINVYYYMTDQNNLINTNVKVVKDHTLVCEYDVLEKLYNDDLIKSMLEDSRFKLIKFASQILNEQQRFKDKNYIICKKEAGDLHE